MGHGHISGMEIHIAKAGDLLLQVPLTYRDRPLAGTEDGLIVEMEHSVLGTRWVYDGLGNPLLITMFAAVSMTGQGEALGMVDDDGRWVIVPANVRIQGGGWSKERIPIDGFAMEEDEGEFVTFRNDRFEMIVRRHLHFGTRPEIGLSATWEGQTTPVILAEVVDRA